MVVEGISYTSPDVYLINESGIGCAEYAARTAYDSFDKSENTDIAELNSAISRGDVPDNIIPTLRNIESSKILYDLAWVYHHHSVIEHIVLTYLIKGTSRGVLQELARHRIQSLTVRSTRYTMQNILHAFNVSVKYDTSRGNSFFIRAIDNMNMFVIDGSARYVEIQSMYNKLYHQYVSIGRKEFISLSMSSEAREIFSNSFSNPDEEYSLLINCKQKRNVGDPFKWIVTDNWKTDIVTTFNLRSLRNFFELRDSGAAYFLIKELAQKMKEVTPEKYLRLVDKKLKERE